MNLHKRPALAVFSMFVGLALLDGNLPVSTRSTQPADPNTAAPAPKIQAAILLDVSNSMDGLIAQAKSQLWNMVSVMGKAKCDNDTRPQIEIALYEYGRDSNDPLKGYIKQISPFTADLDKLSQDLFSLSTYGGSEYCGYVIHTSLNELNWDTTGNSYKTIFISGNEDFLQGTVSYTIACEEARKKGVIVNTIYCGSKEMGLREHWQLAGECGGGSFTCIDQNSKEDNIVTPYDSTLFVLNTRLNKTYIGYGTAGASNIQRQQAMDQANATLSEAAMAKRVVVKGSSALYSNESWDLVDAARKDKGFIEKVDMKLLPDSLQNKTRSQLQELINSNSRERSAIQDEINAINKKRESYIAQQRANAARNGQTATLETEVEKIIREQAARFKMKF